MKHIKEHDAYLTAKAVCERLEAAGHEAYFAGGCVRDMLLNRHPKDFDITTSATPDQVEGIFEHTVPVGKSFGVIRVRIPSKKTGEVHEIEVATYRADGQYSDGRHPDTVAYSKSAVDDVKRRDFTINGMLYEPLEERVVDYVGGERDLLNKFIRAIGNPADRFREDALRLLRACRFAAQLDFHIENETFTAIRKYSPNIELVSKERVRDELGKIFASPAPWRGIELMVDAGLFAHVCVYPTSIGWLRLMRMLKTFEGEDPLMGFILMWDCSGMLNVGEALERYKLSTYELRMVDGAHKMQMELEAQPSNLYQSLARLKMNLQNPAINYALRFFYLRMKAGYVEESVYNEVMRRIADIPAEQVNPVPFLTGDDLIAMGQTPGVHFKNLLSTIRMRQLDEEFNTREEALQFAEDWLKREGLWRPTSASGHQSP